MLRLTRQSLIYQILVWAKRIKDIDTCDENDVIANTFYVNLEDVVLEMRDYFQRMGVYMLEGFKFKMEVMQYQV